MGAKTSMIVCSERPPIDVFKASPTLDRAMSMDLAARLFPNCLFEPLDDGSLNDTFPEDDEVLVGCLDGVSVVAAPEFGLDRPSELSANVFDVFPTGRVYLHAMHSVVDWAAFAVWENKVLLRSLSLSPENGILEQKGARLPFEEPYWGGAHALESAESYPFPFHPLELAETALFSFCGYKLEGDLSIVAFDPESIPLVRLKRLKSQAKKNRPWWKLW